MNTDPIEANATTLSLTEATVVVDAINAFLHCGTRSKFKDIKAAAAALKSLWGRLRFADEVSLEWQTEGLEHLKCVVDGTYTGLTAEDHLHGVNGMFNQTKRDAVNLDCSK